jgi:hypothetical protein
MLSKKELAMTPSTAKYPFNVLEDIDNKIDDIELEIAKLPLNPAVKAKIVDHLYTLWSEIEDCMDAAPTDWA